MFRRDHDKLEAKCFDLETACKQCSLADSKASVGVFVRLKTPSLRRKSGTFAKCACSGGQKKHMAVRSLVFLCQLLRRFPLRARKHCFCG